jgi:hypothetical protein
MIAEIRPGRYPTFLGYYERIIISACAGLDFRGLPSS